VSAAGPRLRVFVDANVLFAAVGNGAGVPGILIKRQDVLEIVTCDMAVEEARRNLVAKRPGRMAELTTAVSELLVVPTIIQGATIPLNDKDRPILYSARACRAQALLTGDKGFREVAAAEKTGAANSW
jgi:predicted nucleic acid-binding protein